MGDLPEDGEELIRWVKEADEANPLVGQSSRLPLDNGGKMPTPQIV